MLIRILREVSDSILPYFNKEDHIKLGLVYREKYINILLQQKKYNYIVGLIIKKIYYVTYMKKTTLNILPQSIWDIISRHCHMKEWFILKYKSKINPKYLKANQSCVRLLDSYRKFSKHFYNQWPEMKNSVCISCCSPTLNSSLCRFCNCFDISS
nr:MAG: hypothetical protein DiTV3a_F1ORF2 [Diabrotica toursvirus 3a]